MTESKGERRDRTMAARAVRNARHQVPARSAVCPWRSVASSGPSVAVVGERLGFPEREPSKRTRGAPSRVDRGHLPGGVCVDQFTGTVTVSERKLFS